MEIKGVSGGKDFSLERFKGKLGYATKHGGLKDKREDIMKVVRGSESAIREGRFKASEAVSRLKSINSGLTSQDIRDARKVFSPLESVPAPKSSSLEQAVAAARMKHAEQIAAVKKKGQEGLVRVNRAPNEYMDVFRNKLAEHGTGLAHGSAAADSHYGVAANRGETSDKGLQSGSVNKPAGHQRLTF